ncbi:hypothetical protein D3C78_717400 [compost metagenome]
MTSLAVAAPGSSGTLEPRAASSTLLLMPGLTMKVEPASAAASKSRALRMVPAPTCAPSTSAATARMASSAAGVRMVISIAFRPPATKARAKCTAEAASSTISTGTTGWSLRMESSFSESWAKMSLLARLKRLKFRLRISLPRLSCRGAPAAFLSRYFNQFASS